MQDASLDDSGNEGSEDGSLVVAIDTLEIDGVRPKVGDSVDLKVSGSITKLVNDTATVQPDTINDVPIPPNPNVTDNEEQEASLVGQAQAMDAGSAY